MRKVGLMMLVIGLANGGIGVISSDFRYVPGRVPGYGDLRYVIHYRDWTPEFFEFCRKSKITFIHWHGPFYGYTGLPKREGFERAVDGVREKVEEAHKAGMMVILYIGPNFSYGDVEKRTILWEFYDKEWDKYADYLGPKPPDPINWTQRDREGNPLPYEYEGNKGFYMCSNNPFLKEYIKGILKIVARTGADGIFYDGPHFPRRHCYCEYCLEGFRKYLRKKFTGGQLKALFGIEEVEKIEPPKSIQELLYLEWSKYFAVSLAEFIKETRSFARKLNRNFIITGNYCLWGGDIYGILRGASENVELWSEVVDLVFDEGQYGAGPCLEGGVKRSNSADYKYLVAASHGRPVAVLKTAPQTKDKAPQANLTKLAIAEGVANGGVWQFHYLEPPASEAAIEYNHFLAEQSEILRGSESYSNVALLASISQGYLDLPSYPMALSRFLSDCHIPHRMIIDEDIKSEVLSRYDVLILPEVQMLGDNQVRIIKDYVKKGGGLIVFGETSSRDEYGRLREELGLSEVLGVSLKKLPEAVKKNIYGKGRAAFVPHIGLPMIGRNGIPENARKELSGLPELIRWAVKGNLAGNLYGPETVEFNLMHNAKKRSLLVHLVNYEVDLSGEVKEKRNIPVEVRLPQGYEAKKVVLVSPDAAVKGEDLRFSGFQLGDAKYIKFEVPKLYIYDLVFIDCLGGKNSKK